MAKKTDARQAALERELVRQRRRGNDDRVKAIEAELAKRKPKPKQDPPRKRTGRPLEKAD